MKLRNGKQVYKIKAIIIFIPYVKLTFFLKKKKFSWYKIKTWENVPKSEKIGKKYFIKSESWHVYDVNYSMAVIELMASLSILLSNSKLFWILSNPVN